MTAAVPATAGPGVVIGPPAFALPAGIAGSARAGFTTIGSRTLICGPWLLHTRRK